MDTWHDLMKQIFYVDSYVARPGVRETLFYIIRCLGDSFFLTKGLLCLGDSYLFGLEFGSI